MLNVNRALYSISGVDVNNVEKTANQILQKSAISQNKENQIPAIEAIDFSKFNRVNLGVDLYSKRTDVNLQKQISLTQAGLLNQTIDVSKLNALAAQNLYSAANVRRNVELTQSVEQNDILKPQSIKKQTSNIQLFNISDKNSNAKNGYNPFLSSLDNQNNKEDKTDDFNFFA